MRTVERIPDALPGRHGLPEARRLLPLTVGDKAAGD